MLVDFAALDTATLVFIGTLVFAVALAAFVISAGLAALTAVGVGKLAWFLLSAGLSFVVNAINRGWDRLVRHASTVELPSDFVPQQPAATGTFPRVMINGH
ncbi:hypothetical protein [Pseudarthrobacter sp. PS3-L1]|uniref:hypothetical protein n=1 Tax=Pseudarthrobacter sp. PS3-L1 TaxID=3046207 RepID=UPI0024B8A944|nr:hypothetical protein [Pseudarthrobacter sp. PS3-L1]MDJ0321104.1 hypothetical protein [Pseudarthrobacter sp. PS3-L1]